MGVLRRQLWLSVPIPQVLSITLGLFTFGITIENNDGPSSVTFASTGGRFCYTRSRQQPSVSSPETIDLSPLRIFIIAPTLRPNLVKLCFDLYTHLKFTLPQ